MKKLLHILFDTAWGPAVAWVAAGVLTGVAFAACGIHRGDPQSTILLVLVCLPLLFAAVVTVGALLRSLLRRRFLHALLQILLIVAAQAATGVAYVPVVTLLNRAPTEEFDEAHFGEKQWELVRETGLDFPEGSRGLRLFCDYRCAFDCSYAARISLPGDAATAIAAQLEKLPIQQEQVSNPGTSELDWWPQEDAPRRLERYFNWKAGLVWAFLLDEEDATVLYLHWFTV